MSNTFWFPLSSVSCVREWHRNSETNKHKKQCWNVKWKFPKEPSPLRNCKININLRVLKVTFCLVKLPIWLNPCSKKHWLWWGAIYAHCYEWSLQNLAMQLNPLKAPNLSMGFLRIFKCERAFFNFWCFLPKKCNKFVFSL